MTAKITSTVFGSGETALRIMAETLLHLLELPVPRHVAAMAIHFRSFDTQPVLCKILNVYKITPSEPTG
ncbi:hypothetical protein LTR65_008953 [Meristemomyces frigidus]